MAGTQKNLEALISEHSQGIADKLAKIADWANSEEDVRHETNKLLDGFIRDAELPLKARHEYHLAGGFIDSKYAGVLIEYKSPKGSGRLSAQADSRGNRAAVEQLEKRFRDFEAIAAEAPGRLYGVSTDARFLIYARHRGGAFQPEPPRPVTASTVESLLRAIVSLGAKGRTYSADLLAEHFGSGSELARSAVCSLHDTLAATGDPRTHVFLKQWRLLFGEVTGYDVSSPSSKIKELALTYGLPARFKTAEFLFALHTYYALFIKFLAAEIVSSFSPIGVSPLKRCARAATVQDLRKELTALEEGGVWAQLGITNFLEGDLFSWYLSSWDTSVARTVQKVVRELEEFDPATLSVEPLETRDLLKQLYQGLFPRDVRHDLGEYYTPDWLAEYVLDELGYDGNPSLRILDPACGSGTFLVLIIARVLRWFEEHRHSCGFGTDDLVRMILKNVIGFDLNPLAVMTARTNYLLAIRQLIRHADRLELPVYLCDSVMTPAEYGGLLVGGELGSARRLPTAAGEWIVPRDIGTSQDRISRYSEVLEYAVKHGLSRAEFLAKCDAAGLLLGGDDLHADLYKKLKGLEEKNQNGMWARIIKNAFAPLFIEPVDILAGNPPWINWENLPEAYRAEAARVWDRYELRKTSGGKAAIGRSKHEMAGLFVFACSDMYLRRGGMLGFVVTQSLFKNKGADGFRRLAFGATHLAPVSVTDLVHCPVFEGATNRTATVVIRKQSEAFHYPIKWKEWRVRPGADFGEGASLEEVRRSVVEVGMDARPSDVRWPGSPWLACPHELAEGVGKVLGHSYYEANEGINPGGLVGAYWVRPIRDVGKDRVLVRNLADAGRKKVHEVEHAIERALLYPYVRGRDVQMWRATSNCLCVVPHAPENHEALTERDLRARFPQAYAYFARFKDKLLARKSAPVQSCMERFGFFALFGVGDHTFSPWKVVFKDLTDLFQAAVLGPGGKAEMDRPCLADYTLRIVPAKSELEAHYICGLLNASPSRIALYYSSAGVQTQRYHASDAEKVAIHRYEGEPLQRSVAEASLRCHEATAKGATEQAEAEARLDAAAAEVWRIDAATLGALRAEVGRLSGSANGRDAREEETAEEE